jgi:acyl-CoA dehydrogenase
MLERTRPQSPFYTPEHEAFRDVMRRFVAREIEPYASEWDEAGEFPRELYVKAAAVGLLGLGFPEEYGGLPADQFMKIVASQELARAGAGGVNASLMSHSIGSPPIARAARPEVKARVLPQVLSGQKISALAITEPSGRLRRRQSQNQSAPRRRSLCRQRREDLYHLGHARRLSHGRRPHRRRRRKRRQPVAHSRRYAGLVAHQAEEDGLVGVRYRDAAFRRVPCAGGKPDRREGHGFKIIMQNFNSERMGMAAGCTAYARVCLEEAITYAKERKTFGKPIAQHQVIRHKIVDMAQRVAASQAMLELLAWRLGQGESPVAEICMMKNMATQTMAFCASEAVQIFGGAGFVRGVKVERIYREVKVNAIGGGTEEIMKDLASRQMGL